MDVTEARQLLLVLPVEVGLLSAQAQGKRAALPGLPVVGPRWLSSGEYSEPVGGLLGKGCSGRLRLREAVGAARASDPSASSPRVHRREEIQDHRTGGAARDSDMGARLAEDHRVVRD